MSSCSASVWLDRRRQRHRHSPWQAQFHQEDRRGFRAPLDTRRRLRALDDQPVDLVFLLLAPKGAGADHLKALSRVARVLRDQDLTARLRACETAAAIFACLNQDAGTNAA